MKGGLLITAIDKDNEVVLGGTLVSINGLSMDEVKQKMTPMLSHDNEVYLERQFLGTFYVYEVLNNYDVVDSMQDITLQVKVDGKIQSIKMNAISQDDKSTQIVKLKVPTMPTAMDKSKLYYFKAIDEKTLYIQYNACSEDKELSMETFADQVGEALNKEKYERVLIDLRYNTGGSDGVIRPLLTMLEERLEKKEIKLEVLIGENTFSSAVINTVMLKEIGATMIGMPTGGSVDHYGAVSDFELPNSKIIIQYSTKYCELYKIFESVKKFGQSTFIPDVEVEQTISDYMQGKDTVVEACLAEG